MHITSSDDIRRIISDIDLLRTRMFEPWKEWLWPDITLSLPEDEHRAFTWEELTPDQKWKMLERYVGWINFTGEEVDTIIGNATQGLEGSWLFAGVDLPNVPGFPVVNMSNLRFPLGQTVITQGANTKLSPDQITKLLQRHQSGDWGEVPPEDAQENELSVKEGFRLLSAYTVEGVKYWVITERDRSVTTILLPSEY